jgi:hypothetical protein
MANSIKRNVSKGITVAALVAAVGIAVLVVDHFVPIPPEVKAAAVVALCGALYAGVDAIKHRG